MNVETVWQLAIILGLVGFGIWLSFLTFKLNQSLGDIGHRGDDIDEIRESVEIVAAILERLPEMLLTFHQHQSPLQPLIEWFVNKNIDQNMLDSNNENITSPRDASGQYATATPRENEDTKTPI